MGETTFLKSSGIGLLVGSFGAYIVILVSSVLPHYVAYWDRLNTFASLMLQNRNPELWAALGFHASEQKVGITLKDTSNGEAYPSYEIQDLPVSKSVLSAIAKGILVDGKTFSEGEWVTKSQVTTSPKFRKLQKQWLKAGYIRPNHPDNTRMGYAFTKKGATVLYEYAGMPLPSPTALNVVKIA